MNIYEKLQDVRYQLSKKKLSKSGFNKHSGFKYFELSDFLPQITELMKNSKLCSNISFGGKTAVLKIINSEKPEEIVKFYSPVGLAKVSNLHDAQNVGASQTYTRRYLYMNAFEIVANDEIDLISNNETKPRNVTQKTQTATNATQNKSYSLAQQTCDDRGSPIMPNKADDGGLECPLCQSKMWKNKGVQEYYYCGGYRDGCKYKYVPSSDTAPQEEGENAYTDEDVPF